MTMLASAQRRSVLVNKPWPCSPLRRLQGFNLIELMVGLTIALFLLVVIGGMLINTSSNEKTNADLAETSTNGFYGLDVLKNDILHAGYSGLTVVAPTPPAPAIAAIPGECGADFAINIAQPIWGSNDSNPFASNCIPSANYSTGDVLVIRHAGLSEVSGSLDSGQLYFRSAYAHGEVFKGITTPAVFTETPFFDYTLETSVYYISPYTNTPTEVPNLPSLYRLTLGAGPVMTPELVASNVEDMQIKYVRTIAGGISGLYDASSISATEWADVTAVQIWLLVRNTSEEQAPHVSTYTLGEKSVTFNDGFKREVLTTLVRIRNKK